MLLNRRTRKDGTPGKPCTCSIEGSGLCPMHELINDGVTITRRALGRQQMNMLILLSWGLEEWEMAACLRVSLQTVKNTMHTVRLLTRTNNRFELLWYAFENGLLPSKLPEGEPWLLSAS